jgi:hypothetical protein
MSHTRIAGGLENNVKDAETTFKRTQFADDDEARLNIKL